MTRSLFLVAVLIAAVAVACGGGGSSAPSPTPSFQLTGVTPTSGADGVPLRTGINLIFSRPVDEATLSIDSIKVVAENGKVIRGLRTVGRLTPTLVTFSPQEDFVPSTRHVITVTTEVRDTEGQPLLAAHESEFVAEQAPPDFPMQFLQVDLGNELFGGRYFHRATLLPNNRILVAGGYSGAGSVQTLVEVLDPFTNSASIQPSPLIGARAGHIQVLLDDGNVLIAGGEANDFPFLPLISAELWDYRTTGSVAAAPMLFARSFAASEKLADGRVLVTGGSSLDAGGTFIFRDDAEIYDPITNRWTHIPGPAARGRSGHGAWQLSDGSVLLLGGTSAEPSADLLDLATGVFSAPATFPAHTHFSGAAARLIDGRPFYASGTGSQSITIYDEQHGFLSALNQMLGERVFGTATTLPNGRVILAGGSDASSTPALLHTTLDMFVPENGSGRVFRVPNFTLPTPTSHHAAVLDSIGDLWLIGGLPSDAAQPARRQVTKIRFSLE